MMYSKDQQLHTSLKTAASAMKKNKPVFRQWPEMEMDDLVTGSEAWTHWSMAYVNLGITAIMFITLIYLFRRVKLVSAILTMWLGKVDTASINNISAPL